MKVQQKDKPLCVQGNRHVHLRHSVCVFVVSVLEKSPIQKGARRLAPDGLLWEAPEKRGGG